MFSVQDLEKSFLPVTSNRTNKDNLRDNTTAGTSKKEIEERKENEMEEKRKKKKTKEEEEDENIRYLLEGHLELNEEIWNDVAKELNLDKHSLKRRWKKLQREDNKIELKDGRFDDDEDAIILSRIWWGHNKSDVVDEATWNELAKDLNRDKMLVKRRWTRIKKNYEVDGEQWNKIMEKINKKQKSVKRFFDRFRVGKYDEEEDENLRFL